jgi:hypothetical protein
MTTRTFSLLVLTVLFAIVTGTAVAAVTGSPDIRTTLSDNTVMPGEETTLELILLNSGELDGSSVSNPSLNSAVTKARGVIVDLSAGGAPISVNTSRRSIGGLSEGTRTTESFDITVQDDAEPGTYSIPVTLEYDYYDYISEADGARDSQSVEKRRSLKLKISDDATFAVTDVNSTTRVDSKGDLTVSVKNTGDEAASNAEVALHSQNDELSIGSDTTSSRFVDSWSPGEQRTFQYPVTATDSVKPEPYQFTLSVGFDDENGSRTEAVDQLIGVTPGPAQEFSLGTVDTTLRSGEDGELQAVLTNDGPRDVSNVVVGWDSDHTNLSPQETEYAVGDLETNESKTVQFGVDVSDSAREGPQQFDFSATYRDPDGDLEESDTLEVRAPVRGSQDEFELSAVNTTIPAGQSNTIDVTITNTRNSTLSDISAKLFADSPISAGDDEGFVSELKPSESATIRFSVSASGGALEKVYPISIDFQYEEPDGDTKISDTYRVGIDVTTASDGGGIPLPLVGVGVIVLVVSVAGYMFRR